MLTCVSVRCLRVRLCLRLGSERTGVLVGCLGHDVVRGVCVLERLLARSVLKMKLRERAFNAKHGLAWLRVQTDIDGAAPSPKIPKESSKQTMRTDDICTSTYSFKSTRVT